MTARLQLLIMEEGKYTNLETCMKKWLACLCVAALMFLFTAGVALATTVVDGITLPVNLTVEVGATIPRCATKRV